MKLIFKISATIMLCFFFCTMQALPTSSKFDKHEVITEVLDIEKKKSTHKKVIKWGKIAMYSLMWGIISSLVGLAGIGLLFYSAPQITTALLIIFYIDLSLIGIGIITGIIHLSHKLKQRKVSKK